MHDFYQVLGIPRDASPQVVRFAFEGKMQAVADPAYAASAADKREEERLLKEAYVTLSVVAKRAPYDEKLAAWEAGDGGEDSPRFPWRLAAAAVAVVALAAGGYWAVEQSREKERIRLEEERATLARESARRAAKIEEARLEELYERREEAQALSRERSERRRIERERADYDRARRYEDMNVRRAEAARASQERRSVLEERREAERDRREAEAERRAALVELERQKEYLRRQELEEERLRAARHEQAQREARERAMRQYLEQQQGRPRGR